MEETNFGWALAKLRDGYALRRRAWPMQPGGHQVYLRIRDFYEGEYFDLGEDVELRCLELVDGERCAQVTTFSADDVLAYDWELLD